MINMMEISKKDIYIGEMVGQTYQTPNSEEDILCIGKNNSIFAYDLEKAILIKHGDYYINLECITSSGELSKVMKKDRYNNSYLKNKALSIDVLKKIAEQDDQDLKGQFFIVKDNLVPYADKILLDENISVNESKPSLSFKELKYISDRLIKRRNGIDNLPIVDKERYHL